MSRLFVTPAEAGAHLPTVNLDCASRSWVSAFAGMTSEHPL